MNLLEIDDMCEYVKQNCVLNNFINIYELYFCDHFGKKVESADVRSESEEARLGRDVLSEDDLVPGVPGPRSDFRDHRPNFEEVHNSVDRAHSKAVQVHLTAELTS